MMIRIPRWLDRWLTKRQHSRQWKMSTRSFEERFWK